MKRYILTATIFLSAIGLVFSQDYQIRQALDFYKINKAKSGDREQTLTADDIKGSPYLNDDFIKGTIYTTSKYQFVDIP